MANIENIRSRCLERNTTMDYICCDCSIFQHYFKSKLFSDYYLRFVLYIQSNRSQTMMTTFIIIRFFRLDTV